MILEELDFEKEARNIETIAANFKNSGDIKFADVIHDLSAQRVLTTVFIQGGKIIDPAYLETHGIDPEKLAEQIITAYCRMIFTDGIYHADPHPGNILVQPDGSVVFIDFGAVATLSAAMKEGTRQFMEGIIKRDKSLIIDAVRLMGFMPYGDAGYDIETTMDYIYGRFFQELAIDSWNHRDIQVDVAAKLEIMGDLRKLDISLKELLSGFQIPTDWVLLERTIILLMGLCTQIAPDMNPMKTIQPYIETIVLGKDRNWKKYVATLVKDLALSVFKIPGEMNRVLSDVSQGRLTFRVRDMAQSADLIYSAGRQFLYGLFCTTAGALAYFSYIRHETALLKWLGAASLFFGACLVSNMWRTARRRRQLLKNSRQ